MIDEQDAIGTHIKRVLGARRTMLSLVSTQIVQILNMPFVKSLDTDKREGVYERREGVDNPNLADVRAAIERLDGETYTTVCISGHDGNKFLMVGGGNGGFYNVFIAVDIDREFHNLRNPDAAPGEEIILVTGGQAGRFQAVMCVDLKTAIKAAEHFFETGAPDAQLHWSRE